MGKGRLSAALHREISGSLYEKIFDDEMPPEMVAKEFDKMVEVAALTTWYFWFDTMFPLNFAPYTKRGYKRDYKPRSTGYNIRKRNLERRDGMVRPALVYSGAWRDQATANPLRPPRFHKGHGGYSVDGVVHIPRYVKSNRFVPDMIREATYVDERQQEMVEGHFGAMLTAFVNGEPAQAA